MDMVTCPYCKRSFPLDEAIRENILKDFQEQVEIRIVEKEKIIKEMEHKLKEKDKEIEERAEEIANEKTKNMENEMRKKIREEIEIELKAKDKDLEEMRKEFLEFKSKQINEKLDYEKKIFELQNRNNEIELEYQKRMNAKINEMKDQLESKVKEEFSIKEKEYIEQIDSLKRKVDDLNKGLSNESNQLVGEAQEIAIEEKLKYNFQDDRIEPVPKGMEGADIIQTVIWNNDVAGKIIWESKRTKQWKDEWIDKLKEDKMKSGSDMGVIITKTMPRDSRGITIKEGIIVAEYPYLIPVASLLRMNLVNIKKEKGYQSNRSRKESLVYEYIIGNDFRNAVQSMVDSINYAKKDLDKEKMILNRLWAKRNMDLEKAALSLAGIYGKMQSLVGDPLADIPSLDVGEDGRDQRQLPDE